MLQSFYLASKALVSLILGMVASCMKVGQLVLYTTVGDSLQMLQVVTLNTFLSGYEDDIYLLIKIGQAALVIFMILSITCILFIFLNCYLAITMTKEKTDKTTQPLTQVIQAFPESVQSNYCSRSY